MTPEHRRESELADERRCKTDAEPLLRLLEDARLQILSILGANERDKDIPRLAAAGRDRQLYLAHEILEYLSLSLSGERPLTDEQLEGAADLLGKCMVPNDSEAASAEPKDADGRERESK